MSNVSNFINEKTKAFYQNDLLSEQAYNRLNTTDKNSAKLQAVLTEYVNMKEVFKDFFGGKVDSSEKELKALSNAKAPLFQQISKSAGDIRKVQDAANVRELLRFAISTNNSYTGSASKSDLYSFINVANNITDLFDKMAASANDFKKAMIREASVASDKRFVTNLYMSLAYLITVTGSVVYSSSLEADFDYTSAKPIVKNLYFSYKSDAVPEQVKYIGFAADQFRKGSQKKILQGMLNEEFEFAEERIALNENIFDVIVGLVAKSDLLSDLFLMPVYLLRWVVFSIKYLVGSIKSVSDNIAESIALQKQQLVTKDQFDDYKQRSNKLAFSMNQTAMKADSAVELEASKDKKTLNNLQSQGLVL